MDFAIVGVLAIQENTMPILFPIRIVAERMRSVLRRRWSVNAPDRLRASSR